MKYVLDACNEFKTLLKEWFLIASVSLSRKKNNAKSTQRI